MKGKDFSCVQSSVWPLLGIGLVSPAGGADLLLQHEVDFKQARRGGCDSRHFQEAIAR